MRVSHLKINTFNYSIELKTVCHVQCVYCIRGVAITRRRVTAGYVTRQPDPSATEFGCRGRGKEDSIVNVIQQETSLIEKGERRRRILQLAYDSLMSVPPIRAGVRSRQLELYVRSFEPVSVTKLLATCLCCALSFSTIGSVYVYLLR